MPIDFLAVASLLGLIVAGIFIIYSMAMFKEWIGTNIGKFRNKQLLAGMVKRRLENNDYELVQFIFDEKEEQFLDAEMMVARNIDTELQEQFDMQKSAHPNVMIQELTH
jgi:hypothetical protein